MQILEMLTVVQSCNVSYTKTADAVLSGKTQAKVRKGRKELDYYEKCQKIFTNRLSFDIDTCKSGECKSSRKGVLHSIGANVGL